MTENKSQIYLYIIYVFEQIFKNIYENAQIPTVQHR